MRVVFSGGTICSYRTLQRLILIADEIGFMDRPSVTFGDWGTIGSQTEFRRFNTADAPIKFSIHEAPSGPANDLYRTYITADLSNPRFVQTFFEGLERDQTFRERFIQAKANYGSGLGEDILRSLLADRALVASRLDGPVNGKVMFQSDTAVGRRETLKMLLTEASIHVTNALIIAEQSDLAPVSDDPYFCRLLGLRAHDSQYVGDSARYAPFVGLAIAKAILPDAMLEEIEVQDLFAYRQSAKDAYAAWSSEIDSLAARLSDLEPESAERELPKIIATEVRPKLIEYKNEMKSVRDKLFGDLAKKITGWQVPAMSLAYLTSMDLASAFAAFAGALTPSIPSVVDYFVSRRDVGRRNSMAYLIGVSEPDER